MKRRVASGVTAQIRRLGVGGAAIAAPTRSLPLVAAAGHCIPSQARRMMQTWAPRVAAGGNNQISEISYDDSGACAMPSYRVSSGMASVLEPKSVALVGATDRAGSVGATILKNLIEGNRSVDGSMQIYPINPNRNECMGLKCYKSLCDIPGDVELAVFVTPAKSCVSLMEEAAKKKVKAAVVISAGFKEAGDDGRALEEELVTVARGAGIRVIGPNCLGVMNPISGLNATFAAGMGLPGSIGFISQSGAMCTAVLDWSLLENIGFSAFVSIGSMADVNWGDLIDYLGHDPNTKSILIYMEAIGNAQAFLSAAKEVCLEKPIIVIKAGKSAQAASAAASHTGSLAGSHASFEAAMKRVGVLVAEDIGELFSYASYLSRQPLPMGPNLLMITNAGGPAVLATDAAVANGAEIPKLSSDTIAKLDAFLPSAWSRSNPVDILGDAPPERYAKTLEVLMTDPAADGILVMLAPQDVTDPTATAQHLVDAVAEYQSSCAAAGKKAKPVLASWMGGKAVQEGFQRLNSHGIPCFSRPDEAAQAFGRVWQQRRAVQELYIAPEDAPLLKGTTKASEKQVPSINKRQRCLELLRKAAQEGRTLLTEAESKQILEAYGVPTVPTYVCETREEAEAASAEVAARFPHSSFAVKLNSKSLTHKADVGGVKLNVSPEQVGKAFAEIEDSVTKLHGKEHFQGVSVQPMAGSLLPAGGSPGLELILGSTVDPQFGPLVMFGAGGTMVEVFKDTAMALPPLTNNAARSLIAETKIYKALKGAQGKRFEGVDLPLLTRALVGFSEMVVELADVVKECDINPVLIKGDVLTALDARVVLFGEERLAPVLEQSKSTHDPPQHMLGHGLAVRPYPVMYVEQGVPLGSEKVTIRPISSTDQKAIESFTGERFNGALRSEDAYSDYTRSLPVGVFSESNPEELLAAYKIQRPPVHHSSRERAWMTISVDDENKRNVRADALLDVVLAHAKKVAVAEDIVELRVAVPRDTAAKGGAALETRGWTRCATGCPERFGVEIYAHQVVDGKSACAVEEPVRVRKVACA